MIIETTSNKAMQDQQEQEKPVQQSGLQIPRSGNFHDEEVTSLDDEDDDRTSVED